MTAPAAPRMSTELRVWCFPMMALRTRSNSAKRSCTSGRRFCRLSVKEDARVGESKRQHASVKFRNNESHSDLQIGLWQTYFWNSFWCLPWHRWFNVVSTCTVVCPPQARWSQLWGSESSGVGGCTMSIEKLASFPPVTRCQSTPEEVCARLFLSACVSDKC